MSRPRSRSGSTSAFRTVAGDLAQGLVPLAQLGTLAGIDAGGKMELLAP